MALMIARFCRFYPAYSVHRVMAMRAADFFLLHAAIPRLQAEEEARDKTMFTCPVCGILIDDAKRRRLLQEAKALHAGQTVDRGRVIGDPPPTRALSFRFTASTNMFAESGAIGVMEWKKVREQLAQRRSEREVELTQSIFAMPGSAFGFNVDPLDSNVLMRRAVGTEIGIVPSGMTHLWGGVDVRKTAMQSSAILATRAGGMPPGPIRAHQTEES